MTDINPLKNIYDDILDHVRQKKGDRGFCLLCGSDSGPVVLREGDYQGRSCNKCGIVYIDPLPAPGVVDLVYDQHLDSYYSFTASLRVKWVQRIIRKGRLLEVGCGGGHFLTEARAAGFDVAAIEPNPVCASYVSNKLGIDVKRAFLEETLQGIGGFDVIYHQDMLSHFPDPVLALKQMAALVNSEGVLCFEVGSFGGLAKGFYPWMGRPGFPEHLWLYSHKALFDLIESAGLEVVSVRRFGLLPSTVVSTLARILLGGHVSKPIEKSGQAAQAAGLHRLYGWIQHILRYRLGGVFPPIGPSTFFIAARPIRGV